MGKLKLIANSNFKTIDEVFKEFQQFNKMKDLSEYTIEYYEGVYRAFTKYHERGKFVQ